MRVWLTAAVLALIGGHAPPASVLAVHEQLLTPSTARDSLVGASVALDGDRALVGAPGRPAGGGIGIVYVFERTDGLWMLTATIQNPAGSELDNFGASVALAGDHAVIGAPYAGSNEGAAYHFEHVAGTGWTGNALARPASAPTRFGASVALSSEWIVVGAPDSGMGSAGAAFAYPLAGGASIVLSAADVQPEDLFGASVAISGASILVGAPDDDNARSTNAGVVYPFDHDGSTWVGGEALLPDANEAVRFGTSVALSADGTIALIGAPDESAAASGTGAAYVLERAATTAEWPLTATRIVATDGRAGDAFGSAVALSGTDAVIGAPFHEEGAALDEGAAYAFSRRDAWVEIARFHRDGAQPEDDLGSSVAISGRAVIAGGPQGRTTTRYGFAASFVIPEGTGAPCTRDDRCESGACEMGVCCDLCDASCERCGAGGACEALPDSTECTSSCGAGGTCRSGTCEADCPDTGVAPEMDGGSTTARVSGCKCRAVGAPRGADDLWPLALAIVLRIARRTRGPRRRTARSRTHSPSPEPARRG